MAVITENKMSLKDLMALLRSLLSEKKRNTKQLKQLESLLHYPNVLYYTWKTLLKALNASNTSGDIFVLNVLGLLEKIPVDRHIKEGEEEAGEIELLDLKGAKKFFLCVETLKKYERKVWQSLLNRDMSPLALRKSLFLLLELYLSKLDHPIFLTDIFMAALNGKGVVRILALQGMATLMQKHNIEYPNIYGKLYSLFERSIFHTKYKSRLFYLANLFLSSTHLPEALVASFAKRLSRLSLNCTAPDALIITRFIGNLLMRHTSLIRMIQRPDALEVPEDPFLEDESDPMKTRALESSLWELSLLINHCQPSISSAATFINFKLPSIEYDLNEVLDNSYKEMFQAECRKTKKVKPSLTFERPHETVAKLKDDRVYKLWSLTS